MGPLQHAGVGGGRVHCHLPAGVFAPDGPSRRVTSMLALLAVLFIVGAFLVDWKRSRLNWFDYTVLWVSIVYSRLWHRWGSNRPAPFPLDRAALVACNH